VAGHLDDIIDPAGHDKGGAGESASVLGPYQPVLEGHEHSLIAVTSSATLAADDDSTGWCGGASEILVWLDDHVRPVEW